MDTIVPIPITIGADIHLKTTTVTVLDRGKKIMTTKLDNDPQILRSFVNQFTDKKQFSVEASYNWQLYYDLLKDDVDSFNLLHPKKLKALSEMQGKNDTKDSELIATLTYLNFIPRAYAASPETRQFRNILRARVQVARDIASNKNRIHAIINTNIFYAQRPKKFKDLFCKKGIEYLQTVQLPVHERFLLEQLLEQITYLEKVKTSLSEKIDSIDFHSTDLDFLKTVPGMNGKLLCYIVLAEIDTIHRFKNARSLVAYAGLMPKDKSSGEKIRKGHLSKDSNSFLRWALLEASIGGMRKDKALYALYKEYKLKKNSSVAKIVVARKIVKAIYGVLKEQRKYHYLCQK